MENFPTEKKTRNIFFPHKSQKRNKYPFILPNDLAVERGVDYEFRVAGQNEMGIGQEQVRNWFSMESAPTGAPTNLSYNFQTPDTVCVTWDEPLPMYRNGRIIAYNVQFHKKVDHTSQVGFREFFL